MYSFDGLLHCCAVMMYSMSESSLCSSRYSSSARSTVQGMLSTWMVSPICGVGPMILFSMVFSLIMGDILLVITSYILQL